MRTLKVLVVHDGPDFAEGVAISLKSAVHEVEFARNGHEAVEAASIAALRSMSVAGCLTKPFRPAELLQAIEGLLSKPLDAAR